MMRQILNAALFLLPLFGPSQVLGQRPDTVLIGEQSIDGKTAGVQIVNSIGQAFCWCPPGTFVMGSPNSETDRSYDEEQTKVTLSRGFWISKFEVSEREYKAIRGRSPRNPYGQDYPIVDIRSGDARTTADKLTKREHDSGHLPKNWAYSVPTEAQWEYACRAGRDEAYSFGHDVESLSKYGNFADQTLYEFDRSFYRYADRTADDGFAEIAPVGTYLPNAWGIHDMHGNVWEWCRDVYAQGLPGGTDPIGVTKDSNRGRVIRGGSWLSQPGYCRSAMRQAQHDLKTAPYIGFRLIIQQRSITTPRGKGQ